MLEEDIFEGKTLEEVYEKASHTFNCSITHLNIEIVQAPQKGFLGFFAKKAIIKVERKVSAQRKPVAKKQKSQNSSASVETLSSRLKAFDEKEKEFKAKEHIPQMAQQSKKEKLFDEFYASKSEEFVELIVNETNDSPVALEIAQELNSLFEHLCYDIDVIKVTLIENGTMAFIEFSGPDSALLIGKEGYRYKALSYILFNWINEKYNLMVRLEVAQFLSNQEAAICNYLDPVIETIKKERYFKTKILDGILIHIALTKLREAFPDMYVAVKVTQKGEKYILINEYRK